MTESTRELISFIIYIASAVYYSYRLDMELRGRGEELLKESLLVNLKVIFLIILAPIPITNTILCILILLTDRLKYQN